MHTKKMWKGGIIPLIFNILQIILTELALHQRRRNNTLSLQKHQNTQYLTNKSNVSFPYIPIITNPEQAEAFTYI